MIADSSLSSAFDDLADLFLGGGGGGMDGGAPSSVSAASTPPTTLDNGSGDGGMHTQENNTKPLLIEGLVLGHLPMMASLWASQYPRMVAAQDNAPVALVRLDSGTARVELFHPPTSGNVRSRLGHAHEHRGNGHALPNRPCADLAGAIGRAAQVASRVVLFSSFPADELLFARSGTVGAMAVLTGADDASAVGAYKAIKRLAGGDAERPGVRLIRVAVMGSEEGKASAAFHRLADAAGAFLSVPIQLAGHCRQIAGGVPGTILFEGASAMTAQAVLEALSRPGSSEPRPSGSGPAAPLVQPSTPRSEAPDRAGPVAAPDSLADALDSNTAVSPAQHPVIPAFAAPCAPTESVEAAAVACTPLVPVPVMTHAETTVQPAPTFSTPPGLTPLPIRCPFDRNPVLAVDGAGAPQVIAAADAGHSADAVQRLLSVAAWFWSNRELLGMVCAGLRTDVQPVLHLVTDRPTDVNRLIDSDLRLHVRIQPTTVGTLALN